MDNKNEPNELAKNYLMRDAEIYVCLYLIKEILGQIWSETCNKEEVLALKQKIIDKSPDEIITVCEGPHDQYLRKHFDEVLHGLLDDALKIADRLRQSD